MVYFFRLFNREAFDGSVIETAYVLLFLFLENFLNSTQKVNLSCNAGMRFLEKHRIIHIVFLALFCLNISHFNF